jgi:hypothetical protein
MTILYFFGHGRIFKSSSVLGTSSDKQRRRHEDGQDKDGRDDSNGIGMKTSLR